jgi:predicted GNAT family acetyltransferase
MLLDYLSYISFFGLLIILIIYGYIKYKYGFWVIQPVFHIYDVSYYLNAPGIINHQLPEKNKYTNFINIETNLYDNVTSLQMQQFINIIKLNYLRNKDNAFTPKQNNIVSYFKGHNNKSFITFYREDHHMMDLKTNTTIKDKKIIGVISSRPINIKINNGNKNANFNAYYVDYLCVDSMHRKKGIAPQLIQTHHYNQRYINKNIVVSLFKREDELTGIVPLCVYSNYGFSVNNWTKPNDLSSEYKLLEINPQNIHFLMDFIKNNNDKFDIIIMTNLGNIIELIKTKNIFIYVIMVDNEIICAYFFRKSCTQIEKNIEVLSCFASINNGINDIFIQGFKISFWKIAYENYFGFSSIENVSHNNIIINNIMNKTCPIIISPTAYFFYNFAYPTFEPGKVLIIN